ncbi:MAG TPA: transglycosylase SLT domain-containing protein [Vicinamibacterales bacterium]|nr:transglycosylase SLT domain-containing protein [Vicinamibacterales bacterium]
MKRSVSIFVVLLMLMPAASSTRAQQSRLANTSSEMPGLTALTPTPHPPVPRELSQLWLAPERGTPAVRAGAALTVGSAARLATGGDYTRALSIVSPSMAKDGLLGQYATYYAGVAQLGLKRAGDALKSFRQLQAEKPVGYLWEAAAIGEAEAQEALDHPDEAVRIYERLLKGRLSNVEDVYMRMGRAARAARDSSKAAEAFAHVFYEFPTSENAAIAGAELNTLTGLQPLTAGSQRYKVELGRAERLFGARQYSDARAGFSALRDLASGDDKELIQLRIAESDYFTKRTRDAREALRSLSEKGSRRGEALFFYALASRDAGDIDAFLATLERVETEFSDQTWAEDALNHLGTHYIRKDEDDRADAVFREMYERYPRGNYAERAAWKIGWTSYRKNDFAETARVFERAASDFPRSDYRPAWLYWAGRAQQQLGAPALGQQRFALAAADYANSYYGRLALKQLDAPAAARVTAGQATAGASIAPPTLPANGPMVRALLGADMFDDALNELRYAQRVWGDSPAIEATVAWTRQQQARTEGGMRRFQLLRGAITTMRRAYPQFMAAGGEDLPREVLTVIYPIAYWDLIRKYASANGLDPYFVAALVAQESTFVADVKSAANAYGLMQLLPSTARMYARKLKLKYSASLLTDPESNIRMGTAYLADKVKEFGDLHLVLASYNAGERAVHRWKSERPGLQTEEFIDDIPYPETQNYVKKILGTTDDYRRLYGTVATVEGVETSQKPAVPAVSVVPAKKKPAAAAPRSSAPRKTLPKRPARKR